MRLWSIHPQLLDARGLVALWRESLLAQQVLRGRTRGYTRHPQLDRFRAALQPLDAIASYLDAIRREAARRGYRFDEAKIGPGRLQVPLPVTEGQLLHEWRHLKAKLRLRDPEWHRGLRGLSPHPHPLFQAVPGRIEAWEKARKPRA